MQQDIIVQTKQKQKINQPFHAKNNKLSYIFMLISAACWVSGFIYPNEKGIHPWETNMIKAYPTFILCFIVCRYYGYTILYRDARQFYMVTVRNLIFNVFDLAIAAVQFKLPLPIVYNISNTCSVMVMLIQFIYEGKRFKPSQKHAVILALIGITIITNSNYLEPIIRPSYEFKSQFQNYTSTDAFSIAVWSIIFLIMVALSSAAIYMTNMIRMNVFQITFHYGLSLILFNSIIYNTSDSNHDMVTILWGIPLSSLLFTIGQLLFIGSLHYSQNIGITMLLGSSTVVIGYLWSIIRYHEQISIVCIVGSIAVVASIYKIFATS